jgi:hypothetical protein
VKVNSPARRKSRPSFSAHNKNPQKTLPLGWRRFNRAVLAILLILVIRTCFFSSSELEQDEDASTPILSSSSLTVEQSSAKLSPNKPSLSSSDYTLISSDAALDSNPAGPWLNQKDTALAHYLDILLRRYKPDGAFYLAVDIKSNEILAWGQRSMQKVQEKPSYLSFAHFPAASLIKTLTATAAIEHNRYGIKSTIPLLGNAHTLYKTQLNLPRNHRGTKVTLQEAYARSVNPVFGIISMQLGKKRMMQTAEKLGFNYRWPHGQAGVSLFDPPASGYGLAEAGAGFTTKNTLSPLLSAAITRALIAGTVVSLPWSPFLSKEQAPQSPQKSPFTAFSKNTYYGMRELMLYTASRGTARRGVNKTLFPENQKRLEIGGKTGTLDGKIEGKNARFEWFSGFIRPKKHTHDGIAIVVMQYHFDKRTLPSTRITGLIANRWARITLDNN